MKNFHLPLPEGTYQALRTESERSNQPATALAREAIDAWLRVRKKGQRRRAVAKFAAGAAGTQWDLDAALESAAIEQLLSATEGKP
jgi:hypothetical protein